MTPVINPWVFYIISVVDILKEIFVVLSIFVGMFTAVGGCLAIDAGVDCGTDSVDYKNIAPFVKLGVKLTALVLTLAIFIPSEKTITKMIVAQNVTYERVETAVDIVETVYNDIMDLFDDSGDTDG